MKSTLYYGFSYPEAPDHTRTWEYWQTQAEQIEARLKGGYRIPNGVIVFGEQTTATQYGPVMESKIGADLFRGRMYLGSGGDLFFDLTKNGAEVNRFVITNDGNLFTNKTGSPIKVLPYSMAAGAANVTTSTGSGFVTVTFAAGRFSAVPVVQCTSSDHHFNWSSNSQTTSGFTAWMRNLDGTSSPNYSVNVFWQATQMLAAIGPYLASRQADYETVMVQAICHTAGCDNEGVPIVIDVPLIEGYDPLDSNIQCGPCGEPIDDISLPTT